MIDEPSAPVAYRQVKILIVRGGSLRVLTDENEMVIQTGDATVLPAETRFSVVPIVRAELTCIFIDPEYAVDLVYWQYRNYLADRTEARLLADRLYSGIRMTIPLGRLFPALEPSLDRMVSLSAEDDFVTTANQIQALWFTVAQAITDCSRKFWSPAFPTPLPRFKVRQSTPVRPEVLCVAKLLEDDPARNWTLLDLANHVHLSPNHLAELCARAWGYTPHVRLRLIRATRLARLLQDTLIPIKQCVHLVGWRNHAHAVNIFRSIYGVSPSEYRIASFSDQTETSGYPAQDSGTQHPVNIVLVFSPTRHTG